jgi:hypothetical protein
MLTDVKPEDASMRGRAVEMFAQLERALDSVLAHYYTPDHPLSDHFWFDLLFSESFSYSLRREAFESIVRRHEWHDDKRMQQLHRAGRWRNFLAHVAGMDYHAHEGDDPDKELKVGLRDPKRPNHVVTVAEAFQKFEPACEAAYAYVVEVSNKITPRRKDWTYGHVVTDPVAPEDLGDP